MNYQLTILKKVWNTRSLTWQRNVYVERKKKKSLTLRSSLYETEEATLYYKFGYVAFKQNIAAVEPTDAAKDFPSPEFTILISCVKLLQKRGVNLR